MYTTLLKEYWETEIDTVLEKTRKAFDENHDDNTRYLLEFINDFIESEEYYDYLKKRQDVSKTQASTQYYEDDLDVVEKRKIVLENKNKYPLTKQSKKIFVFAKQFEKYVQNEEKRQIINKQERGVRMIREKMAEFAEAHRCMRDYMTKKRIKEFKRYTRELCHSLNINVSFLHSNTRNIIETRIARYKKSLYNKQKRKNRNILNIVKKLTAELNEKYPGKTKRKVSKSIEKEEVLEKLKGDFVDTTVIKSARKNVRSIETKPKKRSKKVESRRKLIVRNVSDIIKKVRSKQNLETTSYISKKVEEPSKTNVKNGKSDVDIKKQKTNKQFLAPFTLPFIPQSNKRRKIKSHSTCEMNTLFMEFQKLDDVMENEYLRKQSEKPTEILDLDTNFMCTPSTVVFDSFEPGKQYKKSVIVTNKAPVTLKCVLKEMNFSCEYEKLHFEITPLIDVMKLAAGCTSKFFVKFTPPKKESLIEGKIKLLSYDVKKLRPTIFWVPIRCIPKHVDLKIIPNHVKFGTIPYWKVNTSRPKILTFKNEGFKACYLIIKRNQNPLDLPELSSNMMMARKQTCESFIKQILEGVIQNVFCHIALENNQVTVCSKETVSVKVRLRNIENVGHYFEKYSTDVYEESKEGPLIGSNEVLLTAEISGHVLKLDPEIIDFKICFLGSVYQTGLYVHNLSSSMLTVCVKFPTQITDYIRSDVSSIYVPAGNTKRIWLKFLPKPSICKYASRYYNEFTCILEFPVYVFVMSKNYSAMPPGKVSVMAILAQPDDVKINAKDKTYSQNGMVNLGKCTIYETVYVDIEIKNESQVKQMYGFTNLPECVTFQNFGFGELLPEEISTLRLFFHPGYSDLAKFPPEDRFKEQRLDFTITSQTVASLGQLKTEMNAKTLKRSIDMMLKQLKTKANTELYYDMLICKTAIRNKMYPQEGEDAILFGEEINNRLKERLPMKNDVTTHMKFTARIVRPLLEFSHQYVQFPPTSCGSYSFKEVEIRAFKGVIGSECDVYKSSGMKTMPDYEAFFRITGDTDDIKVEPSCGILKTGETKKIMFLAKPSTPQDVIVNIARSLKKAEKEQDINDETYDVNYVRPLSSSLSRKSISSSRKQIHRKSTYFSNEIKILARINALENSDYYPAEMLHWRTMEPFEIKSRFVCEIRYGGDAMYKNLDKIYLRATCKVIRPDFITNLKIQRINFGKVPIGAGKTEEIVIQNIKYQDIVIKTSLLNPAGPFRVPYIKQLLVPSEHFFKLPVKFEPQADRYFEEYFEVTSDRTTLSLILEGESILPDIIFNPNFLVCRMETSKNTKAECEIYITNKSSVDLKLKFEKICELEGNFQIATNDTSTTKEPTKKRDVIMDSLSDELDQYEVISIRKHFDNFVGPSNFGLYNTENEEIFVERGPKGAKVRICFGRPEVLNKIEMTSKTSASHKNTLKITEHNKYYLAKYNVKLHDTFIKDFIFIGCIK